MGDRARDFDVGAVGGVITATAVAGWGTSQNGCPTPKGKGEGKEDRSFYAKRRRVTRKERVRVLAVRVTTRKRTRVNGERSLWEAWP